MIVPLADAPHLQRIILTEDAAAIKDLAERYAHRAPIAVGSALPPDGSPVVPVRVACTDEARRAVVARETLDLNHPRRWDYWDPGDRLGSPAAWAGALPDRDARPVELLIVADLPTGEALETFAARSKEIVVLIRAAQLPYLHRLTTRVRMFRLASAADRARDDAQRLRARLVDRLTAGDLDKELLALGPLFDRHDPAEVAAAAAALLPVPNAVDADRGPATVRVDLGRRDQIRPGDLVGILINRVGIARDQIGRITIRDAFCLVELETDDADRVARELTGETIRGRRMTARPESSSW